MKYTKGDLIKFDFSSGGMVKEDWMADYSGLHLILGYGEDDKSETTYIFLALNKNKKDWHYQGFVEYYSIKLNQ
jgi:hypothetical protein